MSLVGKIIRNIGIYDKLQTHFIKSLLLPFATEGQISIQEARFLGEIVRSLVSENDIVEIGTLFGRSTRIIIENKKEQQKLITVDRFSWNPIELTDQQHRQLTCAILAEAVSTANVVIEKMDKSDFYKIYSGSPSLVFLDANHSYESTKEDIDWALSVKAGIICGHDYKNTIPGVVKAVEESGGIDRLVGSLWILKQSL